MLLLLLRDGQDGTTLGAWSLDEPATVCCRTDEQIADLMSLANHVSIGVEQSPRQAGTGSQAYSVAAVRRLTSCGGGLDTADR